MIDEEHYYLCCHVLPTHCLRRRHSHQRYQPLLLLDQLNQTPATTMTMMSRRGWLWYTSWLFTTAIQKEAVLHGSWCLRYCTVVHRKGLEFFNDFSTECWILEPPTMNGNRDISSFVLLNIRYIPNSCFERIVMSQWKSLVWSSGLTSRSENTWESLHLFFRGEIVWSCWWERDAQKILSSPTYRFKYLFSIELGLVDRARENTHISFCIFIVDVRLTSRWQHSHSLQPLQYQYYPRGTSTLRRHSSIINL